MGWVAIRGYRYYRLRRREGGRVRALYFTPGPMSDYAEAVDAASPRPRRGSAEDERQTVALARLARDTDRLLAGLFAPLAAPSGLHLHRRQYRRIRGFKMSTDRPPDPPAAAAALTQIDVGDRHLRLDGSGLPETDRLALAAAARGDPAGLARARELLADPALADQWGNMVHVTRAKLIVAAAGENPLANLACDASAQRFVVNLGWSTAGLAEKLVITRVLHNWLAIQALESRATELAPESPARAAVERCLTQAERRLTTSIRTLAMTRGVQPAEIAAHLRTQAPAPAPAKVPTTPPPTGPRHRFRNWEAAGSALG